MDNTMSAKNVARNASWIIGVKIVQSVLVIIVSMLTARLLGPANFGLINYAASITNFALPIMQLGFNSIIVKELVCNRKSEGEIVGTVLLSCFCSGLICIVGILIFVCVANAGETETIFVAGLYSLTLLSQALEMTTYWFQSRLQSKYTSITAFVAYVIVAIYKIYLLTTGSSVLWFALSNAIDFLIIGVIQLLLYWKLGGQPLSFSFIRLKQLLHIGKYYILSGIMMALYSQTDKIMLKLMMDNVQTGQYSAAVTCVGHTMFFFCAIIDSATPLIYSSLNVSDDAFRTNMTRLYSIIIYCALAQSVMFTLFARPIILILYGREYMPAVLTLRIVVWYTVFSYIGGVRTRWILARNLQKHMWKIDILGAVANIALNFLLIPQFGINGAAAATLITQFCTNIVVGCFVKDLRPNNMLIIQSLNPRVCFDALQKIVHK